MGYSCAVDKSQLISKVEAGFFIMKKAVKS